MKELIELTKSLIRFPSVHSIPRILRDKDLT